MKGRRVKLTDAGVGRLKPDTTEYVVWDSEVPGLGVRVRPSGNRSFVWHGRVQGEPVRATVGPAALMTVEGARKEALVLRTGNAPRTAEGRSGVPLFRDFVLDEWLPAYRRRCAPSSCRSANLVLERQLIPAFVVASRWTPFGGSTSNAGSTLTAVPLRAEPTRRSISSAIS